MSGYESPQTNAWLLTSRQLIGALFILGASCATAADARQGLGGATYTMKEMRVWANDLALHNGYYAVGAMQASLGANNHFSPGDGARIQQQADAFRTSPAARTAERWNSSLLLVSATGVVIKDGTSLASTRDPGGDGKSLRDCAFVSACFRARGDDVQAGAYASPVIAELLTHARETLLNFAGRSVPGRSGYRWPMQKSDYLSSGSNPSFAIAEWVGRLFVGYDYVRPLMTQADRSTMDAWFLGAARWTAFQVNIEQQQLYGNGSTDRLSGTLPWFDHFADATAGLTRTDAGNQVPLYQGGPLCGGFKRYFFTNRHLTLSSVPYLIGLDQGDEALIKTGEFYFAETLAFGVFPTGDHVDLTRSFSDATPTAPFPGEAEKGFNYFMSVVGRLTLMAEWSSRAGRGLASYGTLQGAFGTSDGTTRKDLHRMCLRAASYFNTANGPGKYASITATTDPDLLIDGIHPGIANGVAVSDSWLAGINIVYKDPLLRGAYQRTATGTRPYPQYPLSVGPNQPWSAHAEAIPGSLFMYGGREGSEASDYSVTSAPRGFHSTAATATSIALAWTDPSTIDDRCSAIEIERAAAAAGPYAVVARLATGAPLTASSYTVDGLAPSSTSWFRIRGESLVDRSAYSPVLQVTTTAGLGTGLPTGWNGAVVGSATAGSTAFADGTWTISGSGTDIWNASDGFRFTWREASGDVRITARIIAISNTDAWAKAGIMIRESIEPAARHAFTCVTPGNGIAFQRRSAAGGTSDHTAGPRATAPYWVRLERSGSTVIGSCSSDGATWQEIRRVTMDLPTTVLVGVAVTAHHDGILCTATVTDLQVTAAAAAAN